MEEEIVTSTIAETTSTAANTASGIDWNHVWQVVVEWCVNVGVKIIISLLFF